MRVEMIPTFPGRPSVVRQDGWTTFVSVHDAWWLRTRAAYRRLLARAGEQAKADLRAGYRKFRKDAAYWYSMVGLADPLGVAVKDFRATVRPKVKGHSKGGRPKGNGVCRNGHKVEGNNVHVNADGYHVCLLCRSAANNRYAARRRAKLYGTRA